MSEINQAPSIVLIGQVGKFAGQSYEGFGETIVVGRSKDCDLSIDEGEISRNHAKFTLVGGQWAVEDLGSSNGTFINNVRITQSNYLNAGDTIGLGKNHFTFQPGGSVEAATVVDMSPIAQPASPGQAQAPQVVPAYEPVPQQKKTGGGGCWITCLIVFLVIIGILCVTAIALYFFAGPLVEGWFADLETMFNDLQIDMGDFETFRTLPEMVVAYATDMIFTLNIGV